MTNSQIGYDLNFKVSFGQDLDPLRHPQATNVAVLIMKTVSYWFMTIIGNQKMSLAEKIHIPEKILNNIQDKEEK